MNKTAITTKMDEIANFEYNPMLVLKTIIIKKENSKAYPNCWKFRLKTIFSLYFNSCGISYIQIMLEPINLREITDFCSKIFHT